MNNIIVKSVEITGSGAIILTGPSGCGKGEIAKVLCSILSIPHDRWLSMGVILRKTFRQAEEDPTFAEHLAKKYKISNKVPVLTSKDASLEVISKVEKNSDSLTGFLAKKRGCSKKSVDWKTVSQLEWLEFCTTHGFLVPNRWTQNLVAASIEALPAIDEKPFILDGYPRTVAAAEHLISTLKEKNIPVIKVLHLSISKQEMLHRASKRQREDDTPEALLKRFEFYVDSVQPSIDYMKTKLGAKAVALIDAHQPHYDEVDGKLVSNVKESIRNVAMSALASLILPKTSLNFGAVTPIPSSAPK